MVSLVKVTGKHRASFDEDAPGVFLTVDGCVMRREPNGDLAHVTECLVAW